MIDYFIKAYSYMVFKIRESLKSLNRYDITSVLKLLDAGLKDDRKVIIDGSGRSLQSVLLLMDALETNGYGVNVNTVGNANLRPLRPGDSFIMNSRSGEGKVYDHACFAKKSGLSTIIISCNQHLKNYFDNVIVLDKPIEHRTEYTPLGTEFEQASAVLSACIGSSFKGGDKWGVFNENFNRIIDSFYDNIDFLKKQEDSLNSFIELINDYLRIDNPGVVYFKGLGINNIISQVIAIRYGHLHKNGEKDLRVVYEGHWKSRKPDDLAILISGSGETKQITSYAEQSFNEGMNVFGITSNQNSYLAKFAKRCKGSLIIPGRVKKTSQYNESVGRLENGGYLPLFELNTYLTLDALLAVIAKKNGISQGDMAKTHRNRELE